jgi:NhaP-type Na+/H+ or K+/H+ antiporter
MDGEGQLLTMTAFVMFGAFLLPAGLAYATPGTLLLSVLFLTVVRMLPIFLSLTGTGLPLREKLFLGWFGPRGIASILFTLLMIDQFDFPKEEAFLATVSLTVGLSILLHGLTATPLTNQIGTSKRS